MRTRIIGIAGMLLLAAIAFLWAGFSTNFFGLLIDQLTEESKEIAEEFIRQMPEYKDGNGRDLELQKLLVGACPFENCRAFEYVFRSDSGFYNLTVFVADGRVTQVDFNPQVIITG
jgi:hypothetical protein